MFIQILQSKVQLLTSGARPIAGRLGTRGAVAKHSSICAFFDIVAMHDLELEQLDVKTAFLYGELEEEIYMDQPEGFIVPGKEDLVCKLKRLDKCPRVAADPRLFFVLPSIFHFYINSHIFLQLPLESI
jgi:hypothetical protein